MASQVPYTLQRETSPTGYAGDALPFKDMPEGTKPAQFVLQDGAVMLKGSRSASSGSQAFPSRQVCLETGARDMEPMLFGPKGVLYAFSTVHISANRATPYTIGYVDFPNGVRVLANLDPSVAPSDLACDIPVELRADGENWYVSPVARNTTPTYHREASKELRHE